MSARPTLSDALQELVDVCNVRPVSEDECADVCFALAALTSYGTDEDMKLIACAIRNHFEHQPER